MNIGLIDVYGHNFPNFARQANRIEALSVVNILRNHLTIKTKI